MTLKEILKLGMAYCEYQQVHIIVKGFIFYYEDRIDQVYDQVEKYHNSEVLELGSEGDVLQIVINITLDNR